MRRYMEALDTELASRADASSDELTLLRSESADLRSELQAKVGRCSLKPPCHALFCLLHSSSPDALHMVSNNRPPPLFQADRLYLRNLCHGK